MTIVRRALGFAAITLFALLMTPGSPRAQTTSYYNDPSDWNAVVGSTVQVGGSFNNLTGAPITVDFPDVVFGASLVFENGVAGTNDLEAQFFDAGDNLLFTQDGTRHDFVGITSTDGIASVVVHGLPIQGCGCSANTEFDSVFISGEPLATVPEPASVILLATGAAFVGFVGRRKRG
jgi:hypothetical protein